MKTRFAISTIIALSTLITGCKTQPVSLTCKDLSAWSFYSEDADATIEDTWKLRDGVITCTGTPLGYLYTNTEYTDFILTLDWRWPDENSSGKGGVLVRTTAPHKIWPKSLEAQINANGAGDFWALDGYELQGPSETTKTLTHEKFGQLTNIPKTASAENPPGQWNSYKIIADGPTVTLIVNDKQINKTTRAADYPGTICITSEGTPIQYRNIKITPTK